MHAYKREARDEEVGAGGGGGKGGAREEEEGRRGGRKPGERLSILSLLPRCLKMRSLSPLNLLNYVYFFVY